MLYIKYYQKMFKNEQLVYHIALSYCVGDNVGVNCINVDGRFQLRSCYPHSNRQAIQVSGGKNRYIIDLQFGCLRFDFAANQFIIYFTDEVVL